MRPLGYGAGPQLGRFGLKANAFSLLQQVARGYHQDIGVTADFIPKENFRSHASAPGDLVADPELPAGTVLEAGFYIRMLTPPKRSDITTEAQHGKPNHCEAWAERRMRSTACLLFAQCQQLGFDHGNHAARRRVAKEPRKFRRALVGLYTSRLPRPQSSRRLRMSLPRLALRFARTSGEWPGGATSGAAPDASWG